MDGRAAATSRLAACVPAVGSARKRRASGARAPNHPLGVMNDDRARTTMVLSRGKR
jgi:hypothetical protein